MLYALSLQMHTTVMAASAAGEQHTMTCCVKIDTVMMIASMLLLRSAASAAFKGVDEAYSQALLDRAQQTYDFATRYNGSYR